MNMITQADLASVLKPWNSGWRGGKLQDVTFQGVTFKITGSSISLEGAAGVIFDGCTFEGEPGSMTGTGLDIIGGKGVTVRNCRFRSLQTGLRARDGSGLTVEDCDVRYIRADGVILGGEADFLIQRNRFSDWPAYLGGKHPDAISCTRPATPTSPRTRRGRVLNNTIVTADCQGIFLPDSEDCTVDGNSIATTALGAIGLGGSIRPVLGWNVIQTLQGSKTQAQVNLVRAVDPVFTGRTMALPFGRHAAKFWPPLAA